MKKKILLFTFVSLLFLTACNNQNTDIEKKSGTAENVSSDTAENVSVDFLSEYENCRNKNYVNLDFSNCSARLPELNTCSSLNVTIAHGSGANNEKLENFKKYSEFFFGEYNSSNALFSSSSKNIVYNQNEDDGKHAWYPKIDNYLEQIQNGNIDINSFLYRDTNNNKYLWWLSSEASPHWMNKGEAYSLIKTDDTKVSSWIPSDMDNKVASYFNDGTHNDETYRILDGNVSIGEAVTYFEKDYLSSFPYDFDSDFSINVSTIDVYKIRDDIYCYVFQFSTAWNNIPFDRIGEVFSYQDPSHQYTISGEALMIKKNDIDAFVNLSFPNISEIEKPIENICTLENAVDIMSNTLTKGVKFELQTIEFIYKGNYSDDYETAHLEPSWKFVTRNPNDDLYYCVYVNAVNNECSYMSYKPF